MKYTKQNMIALEGGTADIVRSTVMQSAEQCRICHHLQMIANFPYRRTRHTYSIFIFAVEMLS